MPDALNFTITELPDACTVSCESIHIDVNHGLLCLLLSKLRSHPARLRHASPMIPGTPPAHTFLPLDLPYWPNRPGGNARCATCLSALRGFAWNQFASAPIVITLPSTVGEYGQRLLAARRNHSSSCVNLLDHPRFARATVLSTSIASLLCGNSAMDRLPYPRGMRFVQAARPVVTSRFDRHASAVGVSQASLAPLVWPRTHLWSFVGSVSRTPFRQYVVKACNASVSCDLLTTGLTSGRIFRAYENATFCAQPAGTEPSRAGLFQTISSGCVPVFFDDNLCTPNEVAMEGMRFKRTAFGWGRWSVLLSASRAMVNGSYIEAELETLATDTRRLRAAQQVLTNLTVKLSYFDGSSAAGGHPDMAMDMLFRALSKPGGGMRLAAANVVPQNLAKANFGAAHRKNSRFESLAVRAAQKSKWKKLRW